MSLEAWCPRDQETLGSEEDGRPGKCPVHGAVTPLWRATAPSYDAFTTHLRLAGGFPTYLPWPLGSGWRVSDFGVVSGDGGANATVTVSSGTSELDGPVDVLIVAEEAGVGLGGRCAGLVGSDPGSDFGIGPPASRVRIRSQSVPLWPVSTAASGELDRSVLAGEAEGRWLWVVLMPASAVLMFRDEWLLKDVSGSGPYLVDLPFAGPAPVW
jgi:hypothetical protein